MNLCFMCNTYEFQLLIIIVLFTKNNCNEVSTNPIFRFSSWDFATILKTTGFLDKTLIIKKIFEKEIFLLVLAPRLSGKSTILNMLKRFLEITVDLDGNQKNVKESPNYEIFIKNNLNIHKQHGSFFQKHFGSYPVISIDYKPLNLINNYASMMKQFREIILNTFEPYKYLVEYPDIWENEVSRDRFIKYSQFSGNISLTEAEVRTSFTFLSKILFKRFNKQVFVLMDEFDAFVDSPYLKDNSDNDRIIDFIYTVNYRLLNCNKFIFRAFITGLVRQETCKPKVPLNKVLPLSVVHYNCQKYNCFSKFYGATLVDLNFLLTKFYSKSHIREKVKISIVEKSTKTEQKMQIFSLWSVLRYLANFNTTTECMPY